MMRESSVDKYHEREAGLKIENKWDLQVFECAKFYRCDWQLMRNGKHLAFAEYKFSTKKIKEKGEHYWINLSKIMFAESLIMISGKPWFLFVEFPEGIFYYQLDYPVHPFFEITRFVKKDEDGKYSKQPCAILPIKEFSKLDEDKTSPI